MQMLNILNMERAKYEEIRPQLLQILADSAPLSVPDLHRKFTEVVDLSARDASDCLWRMLDRGDMNIRHDLKVELGESAKS